MSPYPSLLISHPFGKLDNKQVLPTLQSQLAWDFTFLPSISYLRVEICSFIGQEKQNGSRAVKWTLLGTHFSFCVTRGPIQGL